MVTQSTGLLQPANACWDDSKVRPAHTWFSGEKVFGTTYAVDGWYGAILAFGRSWVRILPMAAVYQRQLSVPSLQGRLMSTSLRATGCGWLGRRYVCRAAPRVHCPLSRAMDGCISRHCTTSPCQSAATSKIVKLCCSRVSSCKQRYIKYPDLYLYLYLQTATNSQNDRVYANVTVKHDVSAARLFNGCKHFSRSIVVFVAFSSLGDVTGVCSTWS